MKRFSLFLFVILISIEFLLVFYIYKKIANSKPVSNIVTTDLAKIPNVITVNFAHQIATGSPLVFGGAHAPNLDHQDAWDLIADAGVTMIRRDFFIENELPKNVTLDDYKINKNNVQNPKTWNQTQINSTNSLYQNARQRGMKVMGILSYSPGWLTYSGDVHGVPKDWQVYEDIVKKTYRLHRPYLDMIEIWNEPDNQTFLDLTGSGLSRGQAYAFIFEHAVNAIKSVDAEIADGKKVLVLAPAASIPDNAEIIDYLLSKPISKDLDGISIHSYMKDEPSWDTYLDVMKKYGKEKLPIYVTEWNESGEYIQGNSYITTDVAIPYTAKKLVQFLKYGIAGANYYSTTYYDPTSQSQYNNSFGFYQRINNKSELLPQGKTWQLLSQSLALGNGVSHIYDVNQPDSVEALGFSNSQSEQGVAIVNENTSGFAVKVSLENLKIPRNSTVKFFIAAGSYDPKSALCTEDTTSNYSNPSFLVNLPAHSVVGITFEQPKFNINSLFDILFGASTSRNCLIGL